MYTIDRANACLEFVGLPMAIPARTGPGGGQSMLNDAVTRLEHYYYLDQARCDRCGNHACTWHRGTVVERLRRVEAHQANIKSRRENANA